MTFIQPSPGQLAWHPDSAHVVGVAWSNEPWANLYPESANRDTALFVVNAETNKYAVVQGVTCPRGLGFVDLDLGCSTILLGQ